jgi:hypothetical protein
MSAPRRQVTTWALWALVSAVYMGGMGSRLAFDAAAALALGLVVVASWRRGAYWRAAAMLLVACGSAFPEFTRLDGFWLFAIALSGALPLLAIPATHSALELLPHTPWSMLVGPAAAGLVAVVVAQRLPSWIWMTVAAMITAGAAATALRPEATYEFAPSKEMSQAYRIDEQAAKMVPRSFGAGKKIYGTAQSLPDGELAQAAAVIIGEHDPEGPAAELFVDKNYRQPLPWHGNEFVGNQYWRFAVCRDGALVSNLGSSVALAAFTMLAIPTLTAPPVVLAAKSGAGQTILADSDYFVARLAGYQRNLIGTILGAPEALRRPAAANAAMALGATLAILGSKLMLVGAIGLLTCALFPSQPRGDVRVVGPNGDPHDPARAWAVPRQLADYELPAVPGSSGTSTLVVASGMTAEVAEGETLVVAEPGAKIRKGRTMIEVDSNPLGAVEEVTDARVLIVDGERRGPVETINGTKFIGTGSPALLPKQLWQTSSQ